MLNYKRAVFRLALLTAFAAVGCHDKTHKAEEQSASPAPSPAARYAWTQVTESAGFGKSYNYPLYDHDGKMWAFHPEGCWFSEDGKTWTRSSLPTRSRNVYEFTFVQYRGAVYRLGSNDGNYLKMKFGSKVLRTTDYKTWETLAEKSELPPRFFYSRIVFQDKLWILGGTDGKRNFNDVWNSEDGVQWTKVADACPWAARNGAAVIEFQGKLWLMGGGVIDGPTYNDVWRSSDGIQWELVTDHLSESRTFGYTPVVYDGKIRLLGANRDGVFRNSEMLSSSDGVAWVSETAPWGPRGGVAALVFRNKLWITGGKYSHVVNGEIRFIYYNDLWRLERVAAEAAK